MPSFRDVVEPVVIVSLFTVGTLVNRRRGSRHDIEARLPLVDDSDSSDTSSPPLKAIYLDHPRRYTRRNAPNLFFDLLSRFWNKYPFLPEIWYWNLTYWVYQLLRAFSARLIAGNAAIFDTARLHALQILLFERSIGIDMELAVQRLVLERYPFLMHILARVYYSHICVGVAFIVYVYSCTPRAAYKRVRYALAADNAIAFAVISLWRCSPPRLLPLGYGYTDVLHGGMNAGGENAWTHNRFQLTIAAMPSLHFGTALLLAVYLCRHAPHRVVRVLAPVWPAAMLFTIVATANHFLMDAVVGAVIPWLGWRYGGVLGGLSGVQEWMLGPVRRRMNIEEVDEDGGKVMID